MRFMGNWVPHEASRTRSGFAWRVEPESASAAAWIGNEVEALYTNGPAGGAGATRLVREILAVTSMLLPRDQVRCHVDVREA